MAASQQIFIHYNEEIRYLERFIEEVIDETEDEPLKIGTKSLDRVNVVVMELLTQALEEGDGAKIDKLLEMQEVLGNISFDRLASTAPTDGSYQIEYHGSASSSSSQNSSHSSESGSSSVLDDNPNDTSEGLSFHSHFEPQGPEECPICMEEYQPEDMRCLLECGQHRYCKTCMERHLGTYIEDAEIERINCPHPSCSAVPAEYELDNLVRNELYEKWLNFRALALIKDDKNTKWCWNKECGQPITWDPKETTVVCPACKTEFCFDCSRALHPGLTCDGVPLPDAEKLFQEWRAEMGVLAKECPSCKNIIEKNAGCNHMTCKCTYQWCWLCCEEYAAGHYGSGPCEGFQFAAANTREEAVAAREAQQKAAAEQERVRREQEEQQRIRREQEESAQLAIPILVPTSSAAAPRRQRRTRLFDRRPSIQRGGPS